MNIGVLALVGVTPERVAALTAAGYAVRAKPRHNILTTSGNLS